MINYPNDMVDTPVYDRDFSCIQIILENYLKTVDFFMNICGKPSLFRRALTQNANWILFVIGFIALFAATINIQCTWFYFLFKYIICIVLTQVVVVIVCSMLAPYTLLCILTCIELSINPLYYAKHEIFKEAFDGNMFTSLNSVFIQSIANNVLSDETSLSNDDYVMKTGIKLIERHVDTPFISVLALVSVVEFPIKLCTKDIVDTRQMKLFNCHVDPRESVEKGNTVFLFWTLSNDTSENKLNHFVPLINSESWLVLKFIKQTTFVRKGSIITKPLIESVFFKIGMKKTMYDYSQLQFSTSVELDSQNCLSVRPSGIFGWGATSDPFKVF